MAGTDPQLRRKLEAALRTLSPIERTIFLAHRLENLSYAEIAHRTGLTAPIVERHLARAIYRLAKKLDGETLTERP
jgi:RNA polymerase sigma-70 factor (ECF subfamily)